MRRSIITPLFALALCTPALAQTPAKKLADPDRVKCKSHPETGSLVRMVKECHTVAEWERMAQNGRTQAAQSLDVMNSARTN